jgi:hypothetical protein
MQDAGSPQKDAFGRVGHDALVSHKSYLDPKWQNINILLKISDWIFGILDVNLPKTSQI